MARRSVDEALSRLSKREREALAPMVTGASNLSIAESLVVSHKPIETHVSSILCMGLIAFGDIGKVGLDEAHWARFR